jgi:hypothetical protein
MMKNRFLINILILALPAVLPAGARAFPLQSASVSDSDVKVSASGVHAGAPVIGHVFAFPVATKSEEAQRLHRYENVLLDSSAESARKATEKDCWRPRRKSKSKNCRRWKESTERRLTGWAKLIGIPR